MRRSRDWWVNLALLVVLLVAFATTVILGLASRIGFRGVEGF